VVARPDAQGGHQGRLRQDRPARRQDQFPAVGDHYFDKSGQEVKRLICSNPTSFDGIVRNKMAIFSDPRTGHRTELETTSAKYNQGLSDDLFTVRQLEWGR
jgi:hypothetical protein